MGGNTPFCVLDDVPLRQLLLDNYIKPAAGWLLGPETNEGVLPQAVGSPWECAFSIMVLIHLYEEIAANPNMTPKDSYLVEQIEEKVPESVRWLISVANKHSDGLEWEAGIYDTSVCLRAILHAHEKFPITLRLPENEIRDICKRSIKWLVDEFDGDKENNRHPHDPIAVSQYLRTLICVYRYCCHFLSKSSLVQTIHETAFFLINAGPNIDTITSVSEDFPPFWGDDACTAEAVDALGRYIWDCTHDAVGKYISSIRHAKIPGGNREVIERGKKLLYASTVHLAVRQADGKWGSEMDSAAAHCGYLRACRAIGVRHEDYIVLRSLRWLCGEQVFSDGSFLHTSYVTVYYSLALWETYKHWPLIADNPTSVVYDEALRAAPYRPTTERAIRFDLELTNQRLTEQIQDVSAGHYKTVLTLLSALAFTGVVLATVVVMYMTGVIKLEITKENAGNVVAFIGSLVGLFGILVSVIITLLRRPSRIA